MITSPPPISSPTWSSRTKRVVVALSCLGAIFAFIWLSDILPQLVIAIVIAYLLAPLATFIDERILIFPPFRNRRSRGFAVLLTFILVLLLFIVVLLVVIPAFVNQVEDFGRQVPRILTSLVERLEKVLSEPITFNGEPILLNDEPLIPLNQIEEATGTRDIGQLLQLDNLDIAGALQTFTNSLGGLTGSAFSFLGGAVTTLVNIGFLLTMIFYFIKDGARFAENIIKLVPDTYRNDARRLLYELGRVWNAYLRGQILVGLIVGFAVYLAASILGLPNAPILGVISGLLEFVPAIGPFLSLLLAVFLSLVSQSTTMPFLSGLPFMLVVLVVWAIIQNIEALILIPRIMGVSLDLHPLIVILGVLGGASVAGVIGIILAAPFIASGRVIAQYIYGKLNDRDPFPQPIIRRQRKLVVPMWVQPLWERAQVLFRNWLARRQMDSIT